MLEHTLRRAVLLTEKERVVTVVNSDHTRFLREDPPGVILEQPERKGTGTAVLLANEYVRSRDRNATVIIFPSDHFVYPEDRFVAQLSNVMSSTSVLEDCAVLLGARAVSEEPDYGWITVATAPESDDVGTGELWRVAAFHEKPSHEKCAEFFRTARCFWNTMIVAVRANSLWLFGRLCVPSLTDRLEGLFTDRRRRTDTPFSAESHHLPVSLYEKLPNVDFSRDILMNIIDRIRVSPMHGLYWSDWGRPERIISTIRQFGLKPNFFDERISVGTASTDALRKEGEDGQGAPLTKASVF